MATMSIQQELLREVYHDHTHFERMFADLKETFHAVVTKEHSLQEHPEFVKTANEDVTFLVEEMMHHIAVEEEAIFSIISDDYPQFDERIHHFRESHDRICAKLNEIKGAVENNDSSGIEDSSLRIYNSLLQVSEIVEEHGHEENSLLEEALSVMSQGDCERLLKALREEE